MADWIFDLGVSDGQDTAFYLAKGFNVVGVEADPAMYQRLLARFADAIADGCLHLLNRAASEASGQTVQINVHQLHQGISGINLRPEAGGYVHHLVPTIDWTDLCAAFPVPRYMKIDIEGSEGPFFAGMLKTAERPEFISAEAYSSDTVTALIDLGYTRFKLVDQTAGFELGEWQREGMPVADPDFSHASGPFGLDVFRDGSWLDRDQVREAWQRCSTEFHRTWFDCHAWLPRLEND